MTDCTNKKWWKVQNRDITEEEALKFVYPKIDEIIRTPVEFDRDTISEDKANTLACVYRVNMDPVPMYYFGHPYMF